MTIYIAGAGAEHGRSCFLVEFDKITILFDCGIRVGYKDKFPKLSVEQVKQIDYLFISHIHEDHCGALRWLYEEMNCSASLITSEYTLSKLDYIPKTTIFTDENCVKDINILSGFSGHCNGAKWFRVESNNNSVLFTGDYEENTSVFEHDNIRNISCDVAICDCAYNNDNTSYYKNIENLKRMLLSEIEKKSSIILPVPVNGRGTEIYKLCNSWFKSVQIYNCGVENLKGCEKIQRKDIGKVGITFLGDPQLKIPLENNVIENCFILITGTIKKDTQAEFLVNLNKAKHLRFNIHMNLSDVLSLKSKNTFTHVILTHSKTDINNLEDKSVLAPKTGSFLEF